MSDDNKPKLGLVTNSTEEVEQPAKEQEENKTPPEVKQLMHFRNIKMYLNQMIGEQWLLLYRRQEDGSPVFIPNEHLTAEDQVFLAELAKHVVFNMMSFMGDEE